MHNTHKICIGIIVGVHGIKGEVKVKSFTSLDKSIDKYGTVESQHGRNFEIKVVGHSKDILRVKVAGCDDRNAALELVGTQFFVEREILPETKAEDEFYQIDLIGLDVKLVSSDLVVAKVAGFYDFGAGEILEIKIAETGKLEMLPFNHSFVPEVNVKEGYVVVSSLSMFVDEE